MASLKWNPETVINLGTNREKSYACIVLNRPLEFEREHFQHLWNNGLYHIRIYNFEFLILQFLFSISACIRVLVDGGANQWLKYVNDNNLLCDIEPPTYSTGDMDSITEESSKRLIELKCERIYTPDQDETDCTKSVIAIKPFLHLNKVRTFIQGHLSIWSTNNRT